MSLFSVAEPNSRYQTAFFNPQWVEVLVDCPITAASTQSSLDHQDSATASAENELTSAQTLSFQPFTPSNYQAYTYRVPLHLSVQPGYLVLVPFGGQKLSGMVLRTIDTLPEDLLPHDIKEIVEILSDNLLPSYYWQLLNKVATYYYTDLYKVVKAAFPPKLFVRSQKRIRLCLDNIPKGHEHFCSSTAQRIITLLKSSKEGHYSWSYLKQQIKTNHLQRGISELLKRGWIESYEELPQENQPKTQRVITLIGDRFSLDLNQRQQEILQVLKNEGGEVFVTDFLKIAKTTIPTLRNLEQAGFITIEEREILRIARGIEQEKDEIKSLMPAQQNALKVIKSTLNKYAQILLHGVTGSGKTEVYLQAIAPILAQGKSALILVPEIGLTPQLTDRFRARFNQQICVYHSGLSDGERYDTWRQLLTPHQPQVIIGTRSAIFLPILNLGMIILDEEHDSSFKQINTLPNYHTRTVAQWRAELDNCPLILGSATPSLESWLNIKVNPLNFPAQTYYLSLPERIQSRPLPPVTLVDMRQELQRGNRSIFSLSLQNALNKLQEEQKQGILFVNRRGHSTFVSCRNCGYVLECPHCDVSLSYHYTHQGATELLRCHYCNHTALQPRHCPECRSPYLKFFGSGTQKVTQELTRQFPSLRWLRFDSDTTRKKGAHRQLLDQFTQGEADLLVGTQMLTKGLDLAQVTLVGVIAADGLLYHSDYRSAERAFQTLTQVAGRTGRGEDPGRVIIQTYCPEHPVIQAVRNHDYVSFVEAELPKREELYYPPYGSLILIHFAGLNLEEVQQTAESVAEACRDRVNTDCEILGPAPATIMRVANRYRWHLLLKFSTLNVDQLPQLNTLQSLCPRSVTMTLDVDPLSIN